MIVSAKDGMKIFGVLIVVFCAVLVCTMFLNYSLDMTLPEGFQLSQEAAVFYDAQKATAYVICLVTGGCMGITAAITLLFYVKLYLDDHRRELGLLKALGYSDGKLAMGFYVFGLGALVGGLLGFGVAFLLMPLFYEKQASPLLPYVTMNFHFTVFLALVLLPALLFSILSVIYAYRQLKRPVMQLLRPTGKERGRGSKKRPVKGERPFLSELRRGSLVRKKSLTFFVLIASFSFSCTTQMSLAIKEYSSVFMSVVMLLVGLALAFTTLFLALTTLIRSNRSTIAIMRATGYRQSQCVNALLGAFRPVAYGGFALGTVYQYFLLKLMVDVFFKDMEGVASPSFHWGAMFLSLALFVALYEIALLVYTGKIRRVPVKEMSEEL